MEMTEREMRAILRENGFKESRSEVWRIEELVRKWRYDLESAAFDKRYSVTRVRN